MLRDSSILDPFVFIPDIKTINMRYIFSFLLNTFLLSPANLKRKQQNWFHLVHFQITSPKQSHKK